MFLIEISGARHKLQIANNCIRHDSKTRNFRSFHRTDVELIDSTYSSSSHAEDSFGI